MENKRYYSVLILFYGLFFAVFGCLYFICITKPENNLSPLPLATISILFCIITIIAGFYCTNIKFIKGKQIILILPVLYGIVLFLFDWKYHCILVNDSANIWNAAMQMCMDKDKSMWWYFIYYPNNFKPMMFLLGVMSVAKILGISYFGMALFVNIMGVIVAIICVAYLISKYSTLLALGTELFMFTCLPIISHTQGFYTDSLSFSMGIVALTLVTSALDSCNYKKGTLLLAGIVFGVGVSLKITVGILGIAYLIYYVIAYGFVGTLKKLCIVLLAASLTFACGEIMANKCYEYSMSKEYGEPIIDFVATGLKGNGGFSDNVEYRYSVLALNNKEERYEYTMNYLEENLSEFFYVEHLLSKCRYNFANGNLGAADFSYADGKGNYIFRMFNPNGDLFWRISQYNYCWILFCYTLYLLGAVCSVIRLLKRQKANLLLVVSDLTLLGNIVFLMIWEANNRQLYNQIPVLILGASLHLYDISAMLKKKPMLP